MPRGSHLRKNKIAAPMRGVKPLRGYPKDEVFTSIKEVHTYLDGEKVACLLCGRQYAALGGHITRIHQMTSDDYRQRYGIPYKYGLASKKFRAHAARRMKQMRKDGVVPYKPTRATMEKMWEARRNRRPITAVTQQQNRDKLRGHHGNRKAWHKPDYEEFYRRVKSGRNPGEVGKDKDMPTRTAFLRYLKRDRALGKKYEALPEILSFPEQIRIRKTGERYRRTLVQLRLGGNTWPQVAEIMRVKESHVRTMWYYLKRRKELKKYQHAA